MLFLQTGQWVKGMRLFFQAAETTPNSVVAHLERTRIRALTQQSWELTGQRREAADSAVGKLFRAIRRLHTAANTRAGIATRRIGSPLRFLGDIAPGSNAS